MSDLTIFEYEPAHSPVLSRALIDLEGSLRAAARANVDAALAQSPGNDYTATEVQAMTVVEELRQVNGLDLAAVLLRAKYLREIERTNALFNHPAGYQTLQEMARDQGISMAELSQTLALANIVFPFITENLALSVPQLWEQIGKSNFRELVPVLVAIITGEDSATASVRASVETILDDVAATARAAGDEPTDAQVRITAIGQLLEDGEHLTNRELRRRIRPERTPQIDAALIRSNGNRVLVAEMTEEQWNLLQRRMGQYIEEQVVDLPRDPRQRQIEASRVSQVRNLLRLLEG